MTEDQISNLHKLRTYVAALPNDYPFDRLIYAEDSEAAATATPENPYIGPCDLTAMGPSAGVPMDLNLVDLLSFSDGGRAEISDVWEAYAEEVFAAETDRHEDNMSVRVFLFSPAWEDCLEDALSRIDEVLERADARGRLAPSRD